MGSFVRALGRGVALTLCALAASGCVSSSQEDPIGLEVSRPVQGQALRAWRLVDDTQTLGYAIEFGDPADYRTSTRTLYSVRNPWQQELGTIDGLGRAWRFVLHEREAEWLTSGTLLEGVRAILRAPPEAVLEELPLALLQGVNEPPSAPRH